MHTVTQLRHTRVLVRFSCAASAHVEIMQHALRSLFVMRKREGRVMGVYERTHTRNAAGRGTLARHHVTGHRLELPQLPSGGIGSRSRSPAKSHLASSAREFCRLAMGPTIGHGRM